MFTLNLDKYVAMSFEGYSATWDTEDSLTTI